MNKELEERLKRETHDIRAVCEKLKNINGPIEPIKAELFFDLILCISSKVSLLQQEMYGKLATNYPGPFNNLLEDKREILRKHLEEMTQAHVDQQDGKRTRSTHYNLLANWYEEIGYGSASRIVEAENDVDNPYLLELALIDAHFRVAKKKVSVMLSLLQVIQYIEKFIMDAFTSLALKLIKPNSSDYFHTESTLPEYLEEHKHKMYHEQPILLTYYDAENLPGYCSMIAHTFNDAFMQLDKLLFERAHAFSLAPHLA